MPKYSKNRQLVHQKCTKGLNHAFMPFEQAESSIKATIDLLTGQRASIHLRLWPTDSSPTSA